MAHSIPKFKAAHQPFLLPNFHSLYFWSKITTFNFNVQISHRPNFMIFNTKSSFVVQKPWKETHSKKKNPTIKHPNKNAANTKTAGDSRTTIGHLVSIWKENKRTMLKKIPLFSCTLCLGPISIQSNIGTSKQITILLMGVSYWCKSSCFFWLFWQESTSRSETFYF